MTQPVRLGLLGLGTVGQGVVNVIARSGDEIERRIGRPLVVTRAVARDTARQRDCPMDGIELGTDAAALIEWHWWHNHGNRVAHCPAHRDPLCEIYWPGGSAAWPAAGWCPAAVVDGPVEGRWAVLYGKAPYGQEMLALHDAKVRFRADLADERCPLWTALAEQARARGAITAAPASSAPAPQGGGAAPQPLPLPAADRLPPSLPRCSTTRRSSGTSSACPPGNSAASSPRPQSTPPLPVGSPSSSRPPCSTPP